MLQLLRKIAFPFSLIYALVVHLRNILFDIGFFSSKTYSTPSVCIGNLSVGGTGKTPMIEYLVRMLKGHRVAVLSRGYKRKSKGFQLANPYSTVEELGDEPYQLFRKFPDLFVAVDSNRRNGMEQLEHSVGPEIVLLDDAFQHRKVKATQYILLTTYSNLYTDDWYLPTGNLRDAKNQASRADIIIVTKCPSTISNDERAQIELKLRPTSSQKVLFSQLAYAPHFKNAKGEEVDSNNFSGKKVVLVTGIANPSPLVGHLRNLGFQFEHLEFGDHHDFDETEIEKFKTYDAVITTEKDFVRLDGKLEQLFYLEVAHQLLDGGDKILEASVKALF